MNDQALILFTQFERAINVWTRQAAVEVRKIVPTQSLTPEQHRALEAAIRSNMESLTWSFLCPFDNVGCALPDAVSGYSILARAFDPAKPDEYVPLPRVDIRDEEEDYADMWQDFLATRAAPA